MKEIDLNIEQLEAINAVGNVLLTACPGSGKTRALTYKIAKELEESDSHNQLIIAITFTNRASDEIKKRIQNLNISTKNLWTGTIHSFCLEWILRPYMCYLDELKNGFTIADEYKTEDLIDQLKKEYDLAFWVRISTGYLPSGDKVEIQNRDLVEDYHRLLSNEKLIDFDQILHYSYQLLSKFPRIAQVLKNRIELICVDEYQDTQTLQYAILGCIMKASFGVCNMFMVGDSDQAIYGSLGGVAKSKDEIENEFDVEFTHLKLSGNYRSCQGIIDYYRNFQVSDIDITALGDNAQLLPTISYDTVVSRDTLAEYISSMITNRIEDGVSMNDICVLAPTWYLVIPMGRQLKSLLPEVSFDAVGLSPLLKNKENVWFKVARLFLIQASPENYLIRKRWSTELLNSFEGCGVILLEGFDFRSKRILKIINSITSSEMDGLANLKDCFEQFSIRLELNIELYEQLNSHWITFFEGASKRLENPAFNLAKDIESFRKMFRTQEGVVVNTCHGIKGEEFDTVIAFGLLHGKLPNWNEESVHAADKLLFVIGSRAKRQIHLISETGRTTNSGNPYYPTRQLSRVEYDYDIVV